MGKKNKARKVAAQHTVKADSPVMNHVAGVSPISRAYSQNFNPDYSLVIKDLRRIGILAASFFVLLIVLSFFLR